MYEPGGAPAAWLSPPRSCKMLCVFVCVVLTTQHCVCCALLCGVSAVRRLLRHS